MMPIEHRLMAERRHSLEHGREPREFFVTEEEWDALICRIDKLALDGPLLGTQRFLWMGVPVAGVTKTGKVFRDKRIEWSRTGISIEPQETTT